MSSMFASGMKRRTGILPFSQRGGTSRSSGLVAAITALLLWAAGGAPLPAQTAADDSGAGLPQLIGHAAPPWTADGWINTDPLTVKKLRGKVVLLRFLNDAASGAAALNALAQTYGPRGLAVVAIYFPTPFPTAVAPETVRDLAGSQGFQFPIAIDSRWETLNRYWLGQADAEMTAATFLLDRKGVIRYIQPDGQYEKNSPNRLVRKEYSKLAKEIETLLTTDRGAGGAEKKSATSAQPRSGERL